MADAPITIAKIVDPHGLVIPAAPKKVTIRDGVDADGKPTTLVAFAPDPLATTLAAAGAGLGAFHGYRRTKSIGWTVGWTALGAVFPVVTLAVALAQGFGKPES